MARKRYQRGRVFLNGKNKDKWAGRYREDVIGTDGKIRRVRRYVMLGTKRELPTKRLAERRMDALLSRINGLDYRPGRITRRLRCAEDYSVSTASLNFKGHVCQKP